MTPAEIRDAVIADYRDGHSIAAIRAEHGVARATINRIARAAGLPERKRGPAKRPERRCACGSLTTSKVGICQLCQLTTEFPTEPPEAAMALVGGEWVLDRRRRVMVWQVAA